MMRKLTTEEFIAKAKAVHGDKYIYDKSVYVNSKEKVIITCPMHGDFEQTPSNHMYGFGCNYCARDIVTSSRRMTFDDFVSKAISVHGERYSYKKDTYKNTSNKMVICCRIHGDFMQSPKKHLVGHGCHFCGGGTRSNTIEFVIKAATVHGNKYDYSLVDYTSANKSVAITCKEHGVFMQAPSNHLNGQGCPDCAEYGFKRTTKKAYVYFLESVSLGVIKIGVTHNKIERIRRLTKNTPFQFNVIKMIKTTGFNAAKIESHFHSKFKSAGLSGFDGCTEWVIRTPDLMMEIDKITPQ
jgi:hypothetical protein